MRLRKWIGWIAAMALVFSAGGICALPNENTPIQASADTTADGAFMTDGSGDGSADKPYLIDTAQELYYISTKTNSFKDKYIKMTADIDLSEYGALFNGGNGWPGISNFSGYFDGNGYTVSKLYINETSSNNRGLFNNLTGGGVLNLTVKEATVVSVKNYTGAIAGTLNHANAVLANCIVESGTVKGAQSVGGVVGALTKGTVTYCYNAATVTFAEGASSSQCVGGVVGTCNGTVSNCVNYGTVSVEGADTGYNKGRMTGGVVGLLSAGTVQYSANEGEVRGHSLYTGGIVGQAQKGFTVLGCVNSGDVCNNGVSGNANSVGGVIGAVVGDTATKTDNVIAKCANYGNITTKYKTAGGLVGVCSYKSSFPAAFTVSQCYNEGKIAGTGDNIGGLFGNLQNDAAGEHVKISDCYNAGAVCSEIENGNSVGGFVGGDKYCVFENCYTVGAVMAKRADKVGFLIGTIYSGATLKNCFYATDAAIESGYFGTKKEYSTSGSAQATTENVKGYTLAELKKAKTYAEYSADKWNATDGNYAALKNNIFRLLSVKFGENSLLLTRSGGVSTEKNGESRLLLKGAVLQGDEKMTFAPKLSGKYRLAATGVLQAGSAYTVTGNVSVKYLTEDLVYRVKFYDRKGEVLETKNATLAGDFKVTVPAIDTPTGYRFVGWFDASGNAFDSEREVMSDLDVSAKFVKIWTVTFKDGETTLKTVTVDNGTSADAPDAPEKAGYRFAGWSADFEKVTSDLTVTPEYVKIWTVTFKNGETTLKTVVVDDGKAATAPDSPEKEGYRFTGWNVDFKKVTSDLTIEPEFIKTWIVTFKEDETVFARVTVDDGAAATLPEIPEKEGYRLKAWDKDVSNVTADTVVTPVWIKVWTVTFQDGETVLAVVSVDEGTAASTEIEPIKKGYKFVRWNKDISAVIEDMTVEPIYTKGWTVTFLTKDGVVISTVQVADGESVPENEIQKAPILPNSDFVGWDGSLENITQDVQVKAQYVLKQYTVTFIDITGNVLEKVTVEYGGTAQPSLKGYVYDKALTDIKSNVTIVATPDGNKQTETTSEGCNGAAKGLGVCCCAGLIVFAAVLAKKRKSGRA